MSRSRPVIVISGSRSLTDRAVVEDAWNRAFRRLDDANDLTARPFVILHGDAEGVDRIVAAYCEAVNDSHTDLSRRLGEGPSRLQDRHMIVEAMPADWDRHGRKAGHVRNDAMVARAQQSGGALIAIWDGRSKGTAGAIACAARRRVPTFVEVVHQ